MEIPDSSRIEVSSLMTKYSVDPLIQESLWEKLESNQLWDSFGGVEPVSEVPFENSSETGTVSTYPDGSISVSSVEKQSFGQFAMQTSGIMPMAITGCTVSSFSGGAQYSNCSASEGNFWVKTSMRAGYIASANYGNINQWHTPSIQSKAPFSASYSTHQIIKAVGNNASPAKAQMSYQVNGPLGSNATHHLTLTVSGGASLHNSINN